MRRALVILSSVLLAGCASEPTYNTYRQPQPYNWGVTPTRQTYTPAPVRQQGGPPPGCRNPVYNKGLGFWQCLDAVGTAR